VCAMQASVDRQGHMIPRIHRSCAAMRSSGGGEADERHLRPTVGGSGGARGLHVYSFEYPKNQSKQNYTCSHIRFMRQVGISATGRRRRPAEGSEIAAFRLCGGSARRPMTGVARRQRTSMRSAAAMYFCLNSRAKLALQHSNRFNFFTG
jgi:hypothetical protein